MAYSATRNRRIKNRIVMSWTTTATVTTTTEETISAMLQSRKYLQSPSAFPVRCAAQMLILAKIIESSTSNDKGRTRAQQRYCIYKITCQLSGPARGMAAAGQDGSICELVIPKTRPARGSLYNLNLMLRRYCYSERHAVGDLRLPQAVHTCICCPPNRGSLASFQNIRACTLNSPTPSPSSSHPPCFRSNPSRSTTETALSRKMPSDVSENRKPL